MKSLQGTILVLMIFCGRPTCAAPARALAWLPPETVGLLAIPDVAAARAQLEDNPWRRLWLDPAMAPFREHVLAQWRSDILDPIRRESGLDPLEVLGWVDGALMLAIITPPEQAISLSHPDWILLADLGEHASQVTELLESRLPLDPASTHHSTSITIHNTPLRAVSLTSLLRPAQQNAAPEWLGVSRSWLLLGPNTNTLENVLRHLEEPGIPGLAAQPRFTRHAAPAFETSTLCGWLDLRPLVRSLQQLADVQDDRRPKDESIPMPKRRQMLEETGITQATSLLFALKEGPAGTRAEFSMAIPAAGRKGLVAMLEPLATDASPPSQLSAQVLRFKRIRVDFSRSWSAFEQMAIALFPQAAGVLDLLFQSVGPEGQSGDLRQDLLALLGNDVLVYAYPPTSSATELSPPTSVVRVRSTNATQLVLSLKALTVLLPPPLSEVNEQLVQGHRIYTLELPSLAPNDNAAAPPALLHFTALEDSVAFTTDLDLLRTLLSPPAAGGPPLSRHPGLAAAVEQIGGMNTGYFSYEDQATAVRSTWATLRHEGTGWADKLHLRAAPSVAQAMANRLRHWIDPKLLPPFEAVKRYFHFSVSTAGADSDRMFFRTFAPHPQLPPLPAPPSSPPPPPDPSSQPAPGPEATTGR